MTRLQLRTIALQALEEMLAGEPVANIQEEIRETVSAGGVAITIVLHRPEKPLLRLVQHFTPCERDILMFLTENHPMRYTGTELRESLDRSGQTWGNSTVSTALCRLRRDDFLTNSHDHRGYGLTEAGLECARQEFDSMPQSVAASADTR